MRTITSVCPKCNHINSLEDKGQNLLEVTCQCRHIYHHPVEHIHIDHIRDEDTQEIMSMVIGKPHFEKLGDKTTICFLKLDNGLEVVGVATINDHSDYKKVVGEDIARKHAVREALKALAGIKHHEKEQTK